MDVEAPTLRGMYKYARQPYFGKLQSARIIANLQELIKKSKEFVWDAKSQEEYRALKSDTVEAGIVAPFDPIEPCTVTVDASNDGLGAMLSQEDKTIMNKLQSLCHVL
ncbi:hypothetical protein NDU88_005310 [Pleurodeles waltl]|uniref:Reverse transcriptase/retrotransposon-derived protein RNase H-like domain-containing protein n=1 Tax=Pleurodeles waltl TaxID=8319 RepID=A0AAV7SLA8_PLEWA|nr:hypothetical protein NDU88_005310 [Pleurodeles waltl]